ncbi:MAG: FxDxF family PEP-CTERM protein [Pseudomonadota bacterium]
MCASSAVAATYVDPWTISPSGGISVVFGNNGFDVDGAESIPGETVSTSVYDDLTDTFTDTFDFFLPDGIVGFTLSSIGFQPNSSIQSISVSFNGTDIPLTLTTNPQGGASVSLLSGAFPISAGGSQRLVITGKAGPDAVYGSTATFEHITAPIPEPGAWALMLAGFGGAGAMIRRRRARMSFTPA